MARKATTPTPIAAEADTPGLPAMAALNAEMDVLSAQYNQERDLVNQLLGQAQAADALQKISRTLGISKLAHVKETKAYRALKGMKTPNGSEFSGTWEDFCGLLGMSEDKVNQDIANLSSFGEEALESMSRIGIGYREMRQYRRLPDDERLALIEVAKTGDKEAFADLAETIIAKHAAEKAALTDQLADATANYEGQLKVSQKKEELINTQQAELEKMRRHIARRTPDEEGESLRLEVAGIGYGIEGEINVSLMAAFDKLAEHAAANDCTHEEFMSGVLYGIERALLAVRNKHNVKDVPDGDERPDWTRDDFDADAVAGAAVEKLLKEAGHA